MSGRTVNEIEPVRLLPEEPPLVSFMIATRNRREELRQTLASCRTQTWAAREILVVDDGSSDGTEEMVRREFPEVDLVRFEKNRGSVAARNAIVRRAKGKYILGLDDDSRLVDADACERVVRRLEAEPDLGIVSFQAIGPEFPERLVEAGRLRGQWHCHSFAACGVAIRRALLEQVGLFPEFFFHFYEEPDLCLRAWDAGYRVVQWNAILVYHAFSPENRNEQRNHRRHARNELCCVWMRYPWHLVLPATLYRAGSQLRYAASRGWVWQEPRVWLETLLRLPAALAQRRPVTTRAVKIALAVSRTAVADPAAVWRLGKLPWRELLRRRWTNPAVGRPVASETAPDGKPPSVLVAHAGKQHAYQHAVALARLGMLDRFVTSSYYKPQTLPDRWLGKFPRVDGLLRRRHLAELEERRVVRAWAMELPELVARHALCSPRLAERLMFLRDARFDRWVARRWAGRGNVYWGFQGSCLESLRAARAAGALAVAEFATAHVRWACELLEREAQRHPEWAETISNLHFPAWYRERLEQEPHAADVCVVASEFSRQSLLAVGVPSERIELLPLGVDLERFAFAPRTINGPLRILFVGGIGQRKGIKYLLEAYRQIHSSATELVLVGPMSGSERALRAYQGIYEYRGTVTPAQVAEEMRRAHVLVLPSVFEGFGLVIPEAMATGMPVIASTHTIGPEMIRPGQDGFVLEPDDVGGLAERLEFLARHRETLVEMGRHAASRAQEFSWQRHQARLAELICQITGRDGVAVRDAKEPSPIGS